MRELLFFNLPEDKTVQAHSSNGCAVVWYSFWRRPTSLLRKLTDLGQILCAATVPPFPLCNTYLTKKSGQRNLMVIMSGVRLLLLHFTFRASIDTRKRKFRVWVEQTHQLAVIHGGVPVNPEGFTRNCRVYYAVNTSRGWFSWLVPWQPYKSTAPAKCFWQVCSNCPHVLTASNHRVGRLCM